MSFVQKFNIWEYNVTKYNPEAKPGVREPEQFGLTHLFSPAAPGRIEVLWVDSRCMAGLDRDKLQLVMNNGAPRQRRIGAIVFADRTPEHR